MPKPSKKSGPSAAPAHDRPYDVIVWGATGFTGRLVAEYLAERYGDGSLRWAMAGRSLEKLEAVRAEVAERAPAAAHVDLVVGDSHDRPSLDALAAQTKVVCTTVGPYAQYGSELVAACVEGGTDYCDLTGEVQWVRRMVDWHHAEAEKKGVRIVHCAGFDSIPSDLGTLVAQDTALERTGAPCDRVALYVRATKGRASGGTIASMMGVLREAKVPEVRRVLADPYSLNPEGERHGPDGRDAMGLSYDRAIGAWTGPFLMASVNTRVVRRSHALMGFPWGRDFRYSERTRIGTGLGGLVKGVGMMGGLGAFGLGLTLPPARWLLAKTILPAPGEGPSRDVVDSGYFVLQLLGYQGDDGRSEPVVEVQVRGNRDPGYGSTAVMLAESALCLALQREDLGTPGGVLTPATAMGMTLVERLNGTDVVSIAAAGE
jgi:short subunit dehydrogenase-like uncharacterized protein